MPATAPDGEALFFQEVGEKLRPLEFLKAELRIVEDGVSDHRETRLIFFQEPKRLPFRLVERLRTRRRDLEDHHKPKVVK